MGPGEFPKPLAFPESYRCWWAFDSVVFAVTDRNDIMHLLTVCTLTQYIRLQGNCASAAQQDKERRSRRKEKLCAGVGVRTIRKKRTVGFLDWSHVYIPPEILLVTGD